MPGGLERLAYALSQGARVSWYMGQYLLARRLSGPPRLLDPALPPAPRFADLMRGLADLFERDWANIQARRYRPPHDMAGNPLRAARSALAFFDDLPQVNVRRRHRLHGTVRETAAGGHYPRYYLQDFHYQTDGYLSRHSAELYDHQVEVLFGGGADAMRRQGLVPLAEFMAGRRQPATRLVDLGCGTGRFLSFVKDNYPRLEITALDLSPYYLAAARRYLRRFSRWRAVQANAEALPFAAASLDLVTCVYLFHELPRRARRVVAGEIARVLRPGGRLILVDSLQLGDRPDYDGLLLRFPKRFHEPYFDDYVRQDFDALFGAAGLRPAGSTLAYLSKVMVWDRGGGPAPPGRFDTECA
jgi:ubiquinone/menaquinone biosynthesis C-methylase UbiE